MEIERQSSFCRICKKPFKNTVTSREARKSLYKKDANGVSIQSRFAKFGLVIHHELGMSNSVCRPCESKLNTLEKAELIKLEFGIGLRVQEDISENTSSDPSSESQVKPLIYLWVQ